ncbi:hypothetical protein ODV19_09020 [Lactobacillus amylovorus]|uniref:Uncharacterized protein n=1 Tax=Lactobacillus amylovorus TaxID=1604 RepID=A0AAW6BBQ7_LACAM|nr:hypothetical protein [Lactobacillus amylovorus]MDA6090105.1 hypothetical protein [Lactobacillus amylovorus]MDB6223068.1 hypothetical protein [Lactobacillus amylovorus]MDB6247412.1 hypothetical protein [Lactobacillus amylovorus]
MNFGVKDDGTVVGVKDPVQTCLNIENKINDSIRHKLIIVYILMNKLM